VPAPPPGGPVTRRGAGDLRQVRDRGGRLVQVPRAEHDADPAVQLVQAELTLRIVLAEQGDQPLPVGVTGQRPRCAGHLQPAGRTTTAVP
jgi:hypothetical protein